MTCPRCGAETRPGQKFCAECGLALNAACPNCGASYEPGQKFCAECGTQLPADVAGGRPTPTAPRSIAGTPAPAAERRFVSILFADLVGFTPLTENNDAEEVRELLSRYFELARQVIESYGGNVEKFIGDAVMAVWGAPAAREDDPERAVRAALELVAAVRALRLGQQELALRAAVLSGEAAVSPGRVGEGMVAGDIVNTASRLQSVAPAAVVLVGESTQQATSASIVYEPAGEQILKGKELPVAAWRAVRVVARIGGQGREEGLEPPFVGRAEEFRLLTDQLHGAEREGRLRVVAISGQAGLGKSRLVWELEKYLDGLAADRIFYWHQGRSPSYGEGVTYWALGEMVRRRAGIAESEDVDSTRAKLRASLAEFVSDPDERGRLEPALGALLGIDNADWAQREQLFSAWRTFFERIAERAPTVLVFEDLQWADEGLLDFIEHVLDWSRDKRILIVTLARPELLERRPNFGLGRHAFVAIHLEPLTDEAMSELLRGLVPTIPDDDLRRIVERAEGVPLYAVETIRALIDGGHLVRHDAVYEPSGPLPTLEIPPTLRALIASRLDALDVGDRSLLQDASVIGVVFASPAVAAVSGRPEPEVEARLRALMSKELVALETDPRSPERGQYRFMQALLREVAYGSLSKRDRRARHLAAARYLETLGDDELAGVLASHYVEAYRTAPEGDESAALAAQARVALRGAAERARQLHSHPQAISYFEQAMAVTFDEAELTDLRLQTARSAGLIGDLPRVERYAREVIAWHEAHGQLEQAAEAYRILAFGYSQYSRIDDARVLLTDAIAKLGDRPSQALVVARSQLARMDMLTDHPEQAFVHLEAASPMAEMLGLQEDVVSLLVTKSWTLIVLHRFVEGVALLRGAIQLADEIGDNDSSSRGRFNLSGTVISDDPHFAKEVAEEGLRRDRSLGMTLRTQAFAGNLSDALMILGEFDAVLALDESVDEARFTPLGMPLRANAAIVHAIHGEDAASAERIEAMTRLTADSSSTQDLSTATYAAAMLAFVAGDLPEAQKRSRVSRDSFDGASSGVMGIAAVRASLLMADLEGAREDRVWMYEWRNNGAMLRRWLEVLDVAIAALEGTSAVALEFDRLVGEWRDTRLPLDEAMTLLIRAHLIDDAASAGAREEARKLFERMNAALWFDRLVAAMGLHSAPPRPPGLIAPVSSAHSAAQTTR